MLLGTGSSLVPPLCPLVNLGMGFSGSWITRASASTLLFDGIADMPGFFRGLNSRWALGAPCGMLLGAVVSPCP